MASGRRFDSCGQPVVEETGPKVRALAVRNWSKPSEMLGNVGSIFAALSEFNVRFMGTGSTHHCASGRENADITILFECDDTTFAKIRRLPAVAGSRELDPHTAMRNLDADVMEAQPDELAAIRREHRANMVERLLLNCTPPSLRRITKNLARSQTAVTGVKRPEREVPNNEAVPCRVYIQNIAHAARASLEAVLRVHNIDGGWGNKTTIRLGGNVVDVDALEKHLLKQFDGRIDRLDLGPVSAIIREQTTPTVRVPDVPDARSIGEKQ